MPKRLHSIWVFSCLKEEFICLGSYHVQIFSMSEHIKGVKVAVYDIPSLQEASK